VIAYKVEDGRVRITKIYYGGRNYETLYRGVPPEDEPTSRLRGRRGRHRSRNIE
jgi:hypothetical protein